MLGCCGWSFIKETNIRAAGHSSARSNALIALEFGHGDEFREQNHIIDVLLKYCTMLKYDIENTWKHYLSQHLQLQTEVQRWRWSSHVGGLQVYWHRGWHTNLETLAKIHKITNISYPHCKCFITHSDIKPIWWTSRNFWKKSLEMKLFSPCCFRSSNSNIASCQCVAWPKADSVLKSLVLLVGQYGYGWLGVIFLTPSCKLDNI